MPIPTCAVCFIAEVRTASDYEGSPIQELNRRYTSVLIRNCQRSGQNGRDQDRSRSEAAARRPFRRDRTFGLASRQRQRPAPGYANRPRPRQHADLRYLCRWSLLHGDFDRLNPGSDEVRQLVGINASTLVPLKPDPVAALEMENFSRFIRRCDFKAEPFDYKAHTGHLLRIALRELSGAYP